MKKFYSDIEALCGFTVAGTTSLSTATGITVATSDNSTKLATTAFVKAQGYLTAEVDTLDTVTDRNSVTTNSIGVGTVNIIGTTAGAELLTVDGTFGRLFTVTDDLSDSLFSVNTIAGLPVIEVFADNTINLGAFSNPITIDGSSNIVIPGTITASGYNNTNWNTAYNDRIVSAAVSGTTTKTLTLTQTDGGTISTSWTDINTDTDGYISNVSLVGSTLSFTSVGSAFSGIIDLSTLTPTVRTVYETVKNVSGATILKGTPLAVVAGQTSGNVSDVIPADAADPAKMPAIFIANQNIADQAEGEAVLFGNLTGVNTSAYTSGTTVYVAPGGGWTATKPVHPNLIQNLGVITKQHATNGAGIVTGVGRANSLPNLTAGKIWVGSATYPIESTTVHVDEANGRVGIGTNSPSYNLDVQGPTNGIIRAFGPSIARLSLQNSTKHYSTSVQGSSWLFYDESAGAERLRITSAGNVGIGATDPLRKLHVVGNFAVNAGTGEYYGVNITGGEGTNPNILIGDWHNASANLTWDSTNRLLRIDAQYSTSGAPIVFSGNDAALEYARFTATGNFGIGTTAPTQKLNIEGNILLNLGGALYLRDTTTYINEGSGLNLVSGASRSINFSAGGSERMRITSAGNVGIGTTSPAQKLHVVGNTTITGVTYTDIVQTYSGASIDFRHQDASVVMRVDTANARVGIGTTSPSDKLHVNDTSRFVNNTTNSLGGALYTGTKPSSWLFPLETGSTMRQTVIGQATTAGIALPQLNNYGGVGVIGVGGLNTGGRTNIGVFGYQYFAQNMSTNSSNYGYGGYFLAKGIGSCTDFKGEYIGVYGEGNIGTDAVVSTYGSISGGKFVAVGTTNQTTYGVYAQATGGTTNYSIYAPNGNAYFADRVGIGTTSPSEKLHVEGTTDVNILVRTSGASGNAYTTYENSGDNTFAWAIGRHNAGGFYFNSSTGGTYPSGTTTTRMVIATNGNVGIGTSSPTNKVQVANGNMSITTGYSFILADTDTNWRLGRNIIVESGNYLTASTFQLVAANAVNEGWQFVNDDGFTVLEIGAETSARNVWINAGNLSVGVASPQEKIHVAGNVRIDGGSTAAILETNNATAADAGTTYRTFTTADHYAVFVDYVVYDAGRTNMRTGTFRAVWSTGDVVYTDVSTVDLGATDNVTLTAAISGANINLIVTGPADYTLKYSLKVIK